MPSGIRALSLQLPETFKFKDYAPAVFHSLRERFSIDQVCPNEVDISRGVSFLFA